MIPSFLSLANSFKYSILLVETGLFPKLAPIPTPMSVVPLLVDIFSNDKVILENIKKILKIYFFKKYRVTDRQIFRLSNESYATAERKIREVERKIKRKDPNYKVPNYRL